MRILILGAGGHAKEVYGISKACLNVEVVGFVDETGHISTLCNLPVYRQMVETDYLICGVGKPDLKRHFEKQAYDRLAPPLIHPSTNFYEEADIDKGVVIGACCTVTSNIRIGRSTSINSNCVISHDCRIGKRCHLSGGTILSGNVNISDDVYVGVGAKILPGISIGVAAVVGAGAVVTENVKPYTIVAGCPAKVLRKHNGDFRL